MCNTVYRVCVCVNMYPAQESTVIHTQLVLQPLTLQQLQGALLQLLLHSSSTSSSTNRQPTVSLLTRKASRLRKAEQQRSEETAELSRCAMFKAAADPLDLLTLPFVDISRADAALANLLQSSRLQSVKELFGGDVDAAAKMLNHLIAPSLSKLLMQSAAAAAADEGDDGGGGVGSSAGTESCSAAAAVRQPAAESGDAGLGPVFAFGGSGVEAGAPPPPPPTPPTPPGDSSTTGNAAGSKAGTATGGFVFSSLPAAPAATEPQAKTAASSTSSAAADTATAAAAQLSDGSAPQALQADGVHSISNTEA